MFQLVALITVLMNGQPIGAPLKAVHRQPFESIEACTAFKESEANTAALARLDAMVIPAMPKDSTHTITTSCEPAPQKDDNSI